MKGYNIYYGAERLNTTPITAQELDGIRKTGIVRKKSRFTTGIQQYDIKKCRVVEVIIL